jgi:hypothetical protein
VNSRQPDGRPILVGEIEALAKLPEQSEPQAGAAPARLL